MSDTPKTDAEPDLEITVNGREKYTCACVTKDFARKVERANAALIQSNTDLRRQRNEAKAEAKELGERRKFLEFANQQLTAVLTTAGAPEFDSHQHAFDWATETAQLRTELAEARKASDIQLAGVQAELAEMRSVNRYQRGHTEGYREAEEKYAADLATLRRDLADITEVWGHEITDYLNARREGRAIDAAMKETKEP